MLRRMVFAAALVAAAAVSRADGPPREDTYADVDITFENSLGQPELCPTFDYAVHDKNSGFVLLPKTTEDDPDDAPCPRRCAIRTCASGSNVGTACVNDGQCTGGGAGACVLRGYGERCVQDAECPGGGAGACALQPGCTTVRLPATVMKYVGRCSKAKERPCTATSHCTPGGGGSCVREAAEQTQPHVLSGVCEPGDPEQSTFWAEFPLLNGQFIPLQ